MLEVNNLCFSYKDDREILNNISFKLDDGDFLAILGNNGAGKSTLLKCLNKILKVKNGSVILNGEDLMKMKIFEIAQKVALVEQKLPNIEISVKDMVMLGRKPHMKWKLTQEDHKIVQDAMDRIGIPSQMYSNYTANISGGECQKVVLARSIAQDPKLLLLDEPTSNLDIKNQYIVLDLVREIIREKNIIGIVVIHDINLAMKYCNKFLLLKGAQVYGMGNINDITSQMLYDVYDIKSSIHKIAGQKVMLVD
ncbi:ABC transporter ATP-binding protein [uncultured Anaerococcus sp.]|uniref:ABC transporter ATP-binding protein n=1 Tax=uncultured Anaerococcus sp. TaxID=293428 RepID=UPI002889ACFF|nr:ABC transporter ATP-binding protein [uncultured Anaerococcus sp.]